MQELLVLIMVKLGDLRLMLGMPRTVTKLDQFQLCANNLIPRIPWTQSARLYNLVNVSTKVFNNFNHLYYAIVDNGRLPLNPY